MAEVQFKTTTKTQLAKIWIWIDSYNFKVINVPHLRPW